MMKNWVSFSLVFFIISTTVHAAGPNDNEHSITIRLESPKGPGDFIDKDVIEFIEDGEKTMLSKSEIRSQIIMVLGLNGVGKSTVVSYIYGIPLECKYRDFQWVIDVKQGYGFLTEEFSHKIESETLYPVVYSPDGEDFSYVDNPELNDNHAIGLEIANGFFRQEITKNVSEIKFMLVVTQQSFEKEASNFRLTFKRFADFLDAFDSSDTRKISKSIGIVVTNVINYGNVNEPQMIENFKQVAQNVLREEFENKQLNKNAYSVLDEVFKNNQIEIFSNPQKRVELSSDQRYRILNLLDHLEYIKKADVNYGIRIADAYNNQLIQYIQNQLEKFDQFIQSSLDQTVSNYLKRELSKVNNARDASLIYEELLLILYNGNEEKDFESFIKSFDSSILNEDVAKKLLGRKSLLNFLNGLLPEDSRIVYSSKKSWIDSDTKLKFNNYINILLEYLNVECKNFKESYERTVGSSISDYYTKLTKNGNINNAITIYRELVRLINLEREVSDFNSFVASINSDILNEVTKNELLINKRNLEAFITLLPENIQSDYNFKIKWIDSNLRSQIDTLLSTLINYSKQEYKNFEQDLETVLDQSTYNYYYNAKSNINIIKDATNIYSVLRGLINNENDLKSLINGSQELILDENEKSSLLDTYGSLKVFNELLPLKDKMDFSERKKWLSGNLQYKIGNMMMELIKYLEYEFQAFKDFIALALEKQTRVYFETQINKASSLDDVYALDNLLKNIINKGTYNMDFVEFSNHLNKILSNGSRDDLIAKYNMISEFIDLLPEENRTNFKNKQKWVDMKTVSILNSMVSELREYSNEVEPTYSDITGEYTYTGYFVKISSIVRKINSATNIYNLKTVSIFTTHSVIFDQSFKIPVGKYQINAPDLVIITPRVIVNSSVSVDLTCERVLTYPDNQIKARNGVVYGDKGVDGKPGLLGCNSGNFVIVTESLFNNNYLKFYSRGGDGGPGQDGGDGKDGKPETNEYSVIVTRNDRYERTDILDRSNLAIIKVDYYSKEIIESRGGNAGRGGCGGEGGYGGTYVIQTASNFSSITNDVTGSYGKNGTSGNPGLGGMGGGKVSKEFCIQELTGGGRACRSAPIANFICKSLLNSQYKKYCEKTIFLNPIIRTSYKAAPGSKPLDLNCVNRMGKDAKPAVNIYKKQTEYLKFLTIYNNKFNYSELLSSKFVYEILSNTKFNPKLIDLFDRIEVLNGVKSSHLLSYLQDEIKYYQKTLKPSIEEQRVLNYTLTVISSSICRLNSIRETALIVNIEGFLSSTIKNIKQWQKLEHQNTRELYRTSYENNLKKKIDEANSLIELLEKDVKSNEKNINEDLAKVLYEIRDFKDQLHEYGKQLEKTKARLKKALIIKSIFGGLKIVTQFLSIFGPQAALVGSIAQTGLDIASGFIPNNKGTVNPSANIDSAIKNYNDYLKKQNDIQARRIDEQIKVLEAENAIEKKIPITFEESIKKELTVRIEELPEGVKKYELKLQNAEYMRVDAELTNKDADRIQGDKKITEAKRQLEEAKAKADKTKENLEKAAVVAKTAKLVVDLHNQIKLDKNEIEKVNQQIEENKQQELFLNELQKKIDEFQNTNLKNALSDLGALRKGLVGNSFAMLNYKKWEVKKFLEDLKQALKALTSVTEASSGVSNTMTQIENAIITMMDIYGNIESYVQQIEFSNYIEGITRTQYTVEISPVYKQRVNSMEKAILINAIKERYDQAIEAFSYWSFPFSKVFIGDMTINDKSVDDNITLAIDLFSSNLDILLTTVKDYQYIIKTPIDNYIQSFTFENDNSFYEWSYRENPYEIKRLLKGDGASLYADVNSAKFDAIKFCTLYLRIEIKSNSSANETINNLLKNFFVQITYLGNSFYKFRNEIYSIGSNPYTSEKLFFRYTYGSTENANESYRKLAANKPVLSPYTSWYVKLEPIVPKNAVLFEKIAAILEDNTDVSVILAGKGQYVNDKYSRSNSRIQNMLNSSWFDEEAYKKASMKLKF